MLDLVAYIFKSEDCFNLIIGSSCFTTHLSLNKSYSSFKLEQIGTLYFLTLTKSINLFNNSSTSSVFSIVMLGNLDIFGLNLQYSNNARELDGSKGNNGKSFLSSSSKKTFFLKKYIILLPIFGS